jgi:hypothetical protein
MSREDGNVVNEQVRVGDRLVANRALSEQYRVNTNQRFDIAAGDLFLVTRVYNDSIQVRSLRRYTVRVSYHHEQREVSFNIPRAYLALQDPNAPAPRKLGVKPEDTEDQEFLSVDDPRIQWIWDDLGKYADSKSWCPQYDQLCKDVGVPGRPQDFHVTRTLNGVQIRATIKARSQAEANEMFLVAMSTPVVDPEPAV